MAEPIAKAPGCQALGPARAPADPPPVPAVGANGSGGQSEVLAAAPSAKDTTPKFGGLRGGRPRADGLIPGSPEAFKADRKRDRDRKREKYHQLKAVVEPDALPPAKASLAAVAATSAPAPGALPLAPSVEDGAFLPWQADMLRPVFAELIPLAEQADVASIARKAAQAKLPAPLLAKIEADAKWSPLSKKGLELSAPEVTAEVLNEIGISAKNKNRVVLITSLSSIVAGHLAVCKRLDKIIAEMHRATPPPAPPAAPAAGTAMPAPALGPGAPGGPTQGAK